MRIGINGTGLLAQGSIDAIADHAAKAAADGFASYWLAEHPVGGIDALTALTVVAQRVADHRAGHRDRADLAAPSDGDGGAGV